jgi:hypothetical protein
MSQQKQNIKMISLKIFLLLVILALVTTDALVVPQKDLSLQQADLFQQVRNIPLLSNYFIINNKLYLLNC